MANVSVTITLAPAVGYYAVSPKRGSPGFYNSFEHNSTNHNHGLDLSIGEITPSRPVVHVASFQKKHTWYKGARLHFRPVCVCPTTPTAVLCTSAILCSGSFSAVLTCVLCVLEADSLGRLVYHMFHRKASAPPVCVWGRIRVAAPTYPQPLLV